MRYEVYKNTSKNLMYVFYFDGETILYYHIYNLDEKYENKQFFVHLSCLRNDFSPIKMEWAGNLVNSDWVDYIHDYKVISSYHNNKDYELVEDGEWRFYEY